MQRISGGRYLLLAADAGVCDEQAIRLGAMMPPEQWHACGNRVPVNFHALALAQRAGGATVWNRQLAQDGVILHAAWCGDGAATGMQQLCPMLEAAHPEQEAALRRLMRAIVPASGSDPGAVLALIRQSSHDPAMLMAALDTLINAPPALSDCARHEWRSALAGVWQNYLPPVRDDGFACRLAQLAMQFGFLDLAKDSLRSALHCYGEDAYTLYLLAWCESRTGASREALPKLLHALALAPDYEAARRLQAELSEKLQRWQHLPVFRPGLAADGPLRIEPLGPEHAADLRFQFRDEQIGTMTRLPAIESLEQAQAWIANETSVAGRHAYAVVHEQWGFVGVVAAHCAQQAAYFYFWIGSDYQHGGFGQRAAQLLFAQLRAAGLSEIYTSAERINYCSRHVLNKLGFLPLDVKSAPPDDSQEFYYSGDKDKQIEAMEGLFELCIRIGCPVITGDSPC
jgi:RimJ/RimL family protein N-acetyltransferase